MIIIIMIIRSVNSDGFFDSKKSYIECLRVWILHARIIFSVTYNSREQFIIDKKLGILKCLELKLQTVMNSV